MFLRSRQELNHRVGSGFESSAIRHDWAAVPDKKSLMVARSSALRLDKPGSSCSATWIDADSRATQIRDDQDRFGLVLEIRLVRDRRLCQVSSIIGLLQIARYR